MGTGRKSILVVEDQSLIRQLLVEGLVDAGFDVIEARDGDAALAMLGQLGPLDLVVTDIQMPGAADGNAVGVHAKARYPGLPVIYASGREDTLTNVLSAEDRFVTKPFGTSEMLRLVEHMLRPTAGI